MRVKAVQCISKGFGVTPAELKRRSAMGFSKAFQGVSRRFDTLQGVSWGIRGIQ